MVGGSRLSPRRTEAARPCLTRLARGEGESAQGFSGVPTRGRLPRSQASGHRVDLGPASGHDQGVVQAHAQVGPHPRVRVTAALRGRQRPAQVKHRLGGLSAQTGHARTGGVHEQGGLPVSVPNGAQRAGRLIHLPGHGEQPGAVRGKQSGRSDAAARGGEQEPGGRLRLAVAHGHGQGPEQCQLRLSRHRAVAERVEKLDGLVHAAAQDQQERPDRVHLISRAVPERRPAELV